MVLAQPWKMAKKHLGRWWRLAEILLEVRGRNLSQQPRIAFEPEDLQTLGEIKTWATDGNCLRLELSRGRAEMYFYQEGIINLRLYSPYQQELISTPAVTRPPVPVPIQLDESDSCFTVRFGPYQVSIHQQPLSLTFGHQSGSRLWEVEQVGYNQDLMVVFSPLTGEHFYGGGEQTGPLDKRGRYLEFWNTDAFEYHSDQTLHMYCSIPMIIGLETAGAYGLFINHPGASFFDLGSRNANVMAFGAAQACLDCFFLPGPSIKEVVEKYTSLTGRMPLPPLWSLGFHLSKWSYFPQAKLYRIARLLRGKRIPADAVFLDIDYMQGFRVFTFDQDSFPRPAELARDLRQQGLKLVTIIDPGVKKDPGYRVYQEGVEKGYFLKDEAREVFVGRVWPKDTVFPDFCRPEVRAWWAGLTRDFVRRYGLAGIWNDMNEPSEFSSPYGTLPDSVRHQMNGREVAHRDVHNLYGLFGNQAAYEGLLEAYPQERPFILSRSGFAGVQRYAAVWTGDNRSRFGHLALAIPMNCNLGLSGVAFVGNDVGGFGENCTPELFARWIAMGAFIPFFRVHNIARARNQEPWAFGPEVERISRKFIRLRYRLLPYIYNQFYRAHKAGLPVMAPLVLEHPQDPAVAALEDEYLFGAHLLVAPITQPGQRERKVYLPAGKWFDFWSDQIHQSQSWIITPAPLDHLPLFVRAEAIIPSWEPQEWVGEKVPEELILDIYGLAGGQIEFYEDDGQSRNYEQGEFNLLTIDQRRWADKLTINISYRHQGFGPGRKRYRLRWHAVESPPDRVTWQALPAQHEVTAEERLTRNNSGGRGNGNKDGSSHAGGANQLPGDAWTYYDETRILELVIPDPGTAIRVTVLLTPR